MERFEEDAGFTQRLVIERPELRRGGFDAQDFTELVALRVLLNWPDGHSVPGPTTETWGLLVPWLSRALSRLPTYQGPTGLRGRGSETSRYSSGTIITESAPFAAYITGVDAALGSAQFLVLSATARRTALVQPAAPDLVLFPPMTHFKVVDTDAHTDSVFLRELEAWEEVEAGRRLDQEARRRLMSAHRDWAADPAAGANRAWGPSPLERAPGLIAGALSI
ncbi:hypothetical protein ACWGJX_42990 [Streptomyces sp. NPDC054775]